MQKRLYLRVSGRVQGVCFRVCARDMAVQLDVKGFVRNLRDGAVEIVAEGEPDKLQSLANWARQGPSMARVDQIEILDEEPTGSFSSFDVT